MECILRRQSSLAILPRKNINNRHTHLHVLAHRQIAMQDVLLRHEARHALEGLQIAPLHAVDQHAAQPPPVRLARQRHHEARLARARRTHHRRHLPRSDLARHTLQHL